MYTKRLRQGFREKFQTGIGLLLLVFIIHSVTLVADQSLGTDRLELPWAVGETVVDTVGEIGLNNTPMMMATTILVPQDQPTIQAGIDAAQDGDTVLVSPGTYFEELYIADNTITLASEFHTTGDESFIEQTIIDGQGALAVILVDQSVGPDTAIIGFTIQNGDDGIRPTGKLNILNNRLIGHNDAVDYEGGGGLLSNNYFEFNNDDAIDLDGSTDVIIEGNTILNSGNDGIEFRLHEYSGPTLNVIIRNNFIYGNAGDGIQLIDYPDVSDRLILIEGNLIENNDMAGLGLMDNGETAEDFRAASIPERIHLFNNTFIDNPYGVTGGDNLIALNNLFLNATVLAVKEIDGDSIAAFNLFWNNNVDNQGSNVDDNTTLYVNPFLDGTYQLPPASPAIDAGTAQYTLANDEVVLDLPSSTYSGLAPDLGAYESVAASANYQPLVEAGADLIVTLPNPILLAGYVFDDGLPTPPGVITTTWSQSSGPGTAVFADPSLVNTTITVSEVGLYVLRLTADDGEFVVFDEMSLTVVDGSAEITTIESRISSSADDAEESDTGLISLDSSDLELVADDSRGDQTVGLRFDNLFIPQGANIITATLQFQADEVTEEQTDLFIQGEASDNALPFVNTAGNISDRSMTTTTIPWSPEAWLNQGDVGPDQQVPDITAVIQEIVDRPGWAEGNALALIISGTGTRIADSFDGNQAGAPLLHIEFGSGTTNSNNPPVAADDSVTTIEASPITFDVTNNDSDPDGNLDTASVNTGCSGCFEPGNGNLVNHGDGSFTYSPDVGFSGSDSLRYEICDSETLCDTAVVNITVTPSSTLLFEVRVDNSEDDAEESNSGSMSLSSTDLEIVYESGQSAQKVGLRFDNIDIPQGATIVNATIQFQVDENDSEQTDLTIQGEATDDALAFTFESDNISERLLTNSAVAWAPAPWSTVGEAGPDQQTTNIASLIQEIVNRPGWEAGNALAVIITGSGKRVAESFDGSETAAPLLQIEYSIGSTTSNSSPVATDDSVTTAEETPVTFDVTNNDSDPDGNLDAASAHNTCSGCSEPDNGTLVNEGDGSFT